MQSYLLGIDLGSSSIRAAIYGPDGTPLAIASRPTEKSQPDPMRPGEVFWPHDRIWQNGCAAIREVIGQLPAGGRIEGIAVACLGMDGLPLDAEGHELYPFISWHDNRTVPQFDSWQKNFGEKRQFLATGNQLYTFNTAFRLQWMAQHRPDILEKTDKWVLIGDYFNFKLCGRLATDYTMACCTLLFDPRTQQWSKETLAAAGVDERLLCDPLPSGTVLGGIGKQASMETGLPEGTPVVLGAHDYLCGVLPVGGHRPGTIVNVAGTWDVVQATTSHFTPTTEMVGRGLNYECHAVPGQYSILGAAIGGAVLDWYKTEFGPDARDCSWDEMQARALESGPNGLLFLPHLAGANCPDFDPMTAGALVGLRSNHTRADILAAVLQGLAFQNAAIIQALEACGVSADRLVLVGGGGRNRDAVRLRANILGRAIETSPLEETTALGAAMLAGVGTCLYADVDDAYEQVHRTGEIIEPEPNSAAEFQRYMPHYLGLFGALRQTNRALTGHQETSF